MSLFRKLLFCSLLLILPQPAIPAEVRAVASIKPVHSLLAAVMQGVDQPVLIVDGASSPHHYGLRPSQARLLQDAQLVFWIGPALEGFLSGPVSTVAQKARQVPLIEDDGIRTLSYREGTAQEHGEEEEEHRHDHDHGHDALSLDGHIWLDPDNAGAMARRMQVELSTLDPDNARIYTANFERLEKRLRELDEEIRDMLTPVRARPYIVFHDAYQYFEMRYGLNMAGAITLSPETAPGAERLRKLRRQIHEHGAVCIFSEPQFDPKLVSVLAEDTQARIATLDPLGAELEDGPELYFRLMRGMAQSIRSCLDHPDR